MSPSCSGSPGTYSIRPSNLRFGASANYNITYVNGTLYINPKSNKAKNVKPILDCVDTLINNPSGFKYLARFSYNNPNATPVYVPVGVNNNFTALGLYSGTPPQVFQPGTAQFTIPFDGKKLTWALTTYNGTQKTSTACNASSTSNKCQRAAARPMAVAEMLPVQAEEKVQVYPNPVKDKLAVCFTSTGRTTILLTDAFGKKVKTKTVGPGEGNNASLDVSALARGIYFVTIINGRQQNIFRVIKM